MTRVITYGTYDLLHQGHLNLLRRAKELGDYLIVGVTSDSFDRGRGKLNVRNNVLERVEAVKATGYADEVIIEDYLGQKIDDIQKYDVDIFAIGSDWLGKFDYLNEYGEEIDEIADKALGTHYRIISLSDLNNRLKLEKKGFKKLMKDLNEDLFDELYPQLVDLTVQINVIVDISMMTSENIYLKYYIE